jgi:hypothetical protein
MLMHAMRKQIRRLNMIDNTETRDIQALRRSARQIVVNKAEPTALAVFFTRCRLAQRLHPRPVEGAILRSEGTKGRMLS